MATDTTTEKQYRIGRFVSDDDGGETFLGISDMFSDPMPYEKARVIVNALNRDLTPRQIALYGMYDTVAENACPHGYERFCHRCTD